MFKEFKLVELGERTEARCETAYGRLHFLCMCLAFCPLNALDMLGRSKAGCVLHSIAWPHTGKDVDQSCDNIISFVLQV